MVLQPVFCQHGKFVEINYTIAVQVHSISFNTIIYQPEGKKVRQVVHFHYTVTCKIAVEAAEHFVGVVGFIRICIYRCYNVIICCIVGSNVVDVIRVAQKRAIQLAVPAALGGGTIYIIAGQVAFAVAVPVEREFSSPGIAVSPVGTSGGVISLPTPAPAGTIVLTSAPESMVYEYGGTKMLL